MQNAPSSALVLGHGGFLGSRLCARLRSDFPLLRLHGFDIRLRREADLEQHAGDLRDTRRLTAVLRKTRPDWVFHLAGSPAVKDFTGLFENHLATTLSLFEAADKTGGRRTRIILPGSAAEYGILAPGQMPVRESAAPRPSTQYGYIKAAQSELARGYAARGGAAIVARVFNVLGPGLDPRLAISSFVDQIVQIERGRSPAVLKVGDLSPKRDFVDIEDTAAALVAIARRGRAGEAYNVCSGKSIPVRSLVDELLALSRRRVRLAADVRRMREVDLPDMRGCTRKTARETGWKARISPSQSLRTMLEERRARR